ncbi:MAG: polyphosphate kinase 2 [Wenzhouxiangellaceae bacterium]
MTPNETKPVATIEKAEYRRQLRQLQIEMVKLQNHLIASGGRTLVLFEGRDAAGKDGTIKRVVQHLSPRDTRVVALGKPSERDRSCWYFQRYVAHLPAAQEFVCFNRSWYNRAGVERVMNFCDTAQVDEFFSTVISFEHMLIRSGIQLIKIYLDISKAEQAERLQERRDDPLKQWKISPVDEVALEHWDDYSQARNDMLERTHNLVAPWWVARADNKRLTRLNVLRTILSQHEYPKRDPATPLPDTELIFSYDKNYLDSGHIAG